jgi:PAS domain S-box-containing protein
MNERKRAEAATRESRELHRRLTDSTLVGVWQVALDGTTVYANPAMISLLDLDGQDALAGRSFPSFFTAESLDVLKLEHRKHSQGISSIYDAELVGSRGGRRHVVVAGAPVLSDDGRLTGLICSYMDITARKRAEEALQASLDEKTALLKEVHHRVKNNLQIVISLLNLQAGQTKDRATLDTLINGRNRVRSMALLHETLYRAGNFARIDFAGYVDDLCAHLFRSCGTEAARIKLQTRVAGVSLNLDQAVPCGLIINELASNALKHAFPSGRSGTITVALATDEHQQITLSVSDDGVGLPPGLDIPQTQTLGLQLVCSLAQQLGGTAHFGAGLGTTCTVTFHATET